MIKPSPTAAWTLARLVAGSEVEADRRKACGPFQPLVEHLAGLPVSDRNGILAASLYGPGIDREGTLRAIAEVDPEGPLPDEVVAPSRPAHLGDLRQVMASAQWIWEPWIPAARLSAIAAFEGVGKTRLAMDLARRIFFALPWPDGQPPTFPAGTPTLWVCSDGQQGDLHEIAKACDMPATSVYFNTVPSEPFGGSEIDDLESLERLERFIELVRPGLVFVDSLTNATSSDLCKASDVKNLMAPVRDICQRTNTTIVPLLHVSKDGEALGRRIKGLTRTILQLECPDPEQSSRLRLSISKSFSVKPPPLGVTMNHAGNEYDFAPPTAPDPSKPGRPSDARDKAKAFLRSSLATRNDRVGTQLHSEWKDSGGARNTLVRAIEEMIASGELTQSGGPGQGEQWKLQLVENDLDPKHPF